MRPRPAPGCRRAPRGRSNARSSPARYDTAKRAPRGRPDMCYAGWPGTSSTTPGRSRIAVTDALTLDLPEFEPADASLSGRRFHQVLDDLAAASWLARTSTGYYLTLDREAGEFFLRSKSATFPGQMIAEMFGVGPGPLREEIDNNI